MRGSLWFDFVADLSFVFSLVVFYFVLVFDSPIF